MVEERVEVVYDNPCRYLQQVFGSLLRCLGLEKQEEGNISGCVGGDGGGEGGGGDGGDGGGGGDRGEVADLPTTSPTMDPTDDESISATGIVRRRPQPRGRGPISSGGPGQTN